MFYWKKMYNIAQQEVNAWRKIAEEKTSDCQALYEDNAYLQKQLNKVVTSYQRLKVDYDRLKSGTVVRCADTASTDGEVKPAQKRYYWVIHPDGDHYYCSNCFSVGDPSKNFFPTCGAHCGAENYFT